MPVCVTSSCLHFRAGRTETTHGALWPLPSHWGPAKRGHRLTDRARGFIRSPTAVKPCTRPIFSKLNYCLDGGVCKEGFVDILALTKRRFQAFAATMRVMPTNTVGTTNLFRSGIGIPK